MIAGHLDCSSGASGDMWLGALADAGAPRGAMEQAVAALGVDGLRLGWQRLHRAGIAATAARVERPPGPEPARTLRDIERLLDASGLDEPVRTRARAVFRRLAGAEARVHGVAVEAVSVHEVGALDALADVVGVCAGLTALGLDDLTCGSVAVGGGTAHSAHGPLPVPAPAVVELLTGFPIHGGGETELCTPTGAALLAEFARPVGGWPPLTVSTQGFGAGSRDLPRPNVLRLVIGAAHAPEAAVVEATVDDLSPELLPVVMDRLRAAGAHDAWATPVLMKKGRPGFTVTALADPGDVPRLRDVLFAESTTLGCRWYPVRKHALARREITVAVDGQMVRVKVGEHGGEVVTAAPEFEDVHAAAVALDRTARRVYDEAMTLAWQHLHGT